MKEGDLMEELHNIVKKLHDNFSDIQDILSHMEKAEYFYKYNNFHSI